MRQQLGRHLLPVLQALGNPRVPRRAVEGALGELVDTLHCGGPLPPFKVRRLLWAVMSGTLPNQKARGLCWDKIWHLSTGM